MAVSSAVLLSASALPAQATNSNYVHKMVSGGVGETEEELIERIQDRYNLKVVYTGERGMYLSDVDVSITDKSGKELATGATNGPILLGQLEPGNYVMTASKDGVEKKRNIRINEDLRTYHFTFPIKDEPTSEPVVITPYAEQKLTEERQAAAERVSQL